MAKGKKARAAAWKAHKNAQADADALLMAGPFRHDAALVALIRETVYGAPGASQPVGVLRA